MKDSQELDDEYGRAIFRRMDYVLTWLHMMDIITTKVEQNQNCAEGSAYIWF